MNIRLNQKNGITILRLFILFGLVNLFSSCMMMAPMHMASHNADTVQTTAIYTDPVCGNEIKNVQNELFYDYNGTRYYFHSEDCMNTFKHAPEQYMKHNTVNHHQNNWMWVAGGIAMGAMMLLMFL